MLIFSGSLRRISRFGRAKTGGLGQVTDKKTKKKKKRKTKDKEWVLIGNPDVEVKIKKNGKKKKNTTAG